MPPKVEKKKHRKPLTPLQRKQQKKKYELIHKSKVKSQYYKTLEKEKDMETPDYVKEIFGEETPKKLSKPKEEEKEYDLSEDSSSSEEEEEEEEGHKRHKPNPFKHQLEEREKRQKETEEQKKERLRLAEEKKQERSKYYKERSEIRGKMLSKTKKGQPNMSAQMDVLLQRIQKNNQ
ncbi:hypothetical protein BDB01DRAFT_791471 [Pilobolus umbonatus]|nr:hypothetical protein BDB01DRAFT_791471 [Pilobolus umbonatus]